MGHGARDALGFIDGPYVQVIVTPAGAQIITLFPANELPIANRY